MFLTIGNIVWVHNVFNEYNMYVYCAMAIRIYWNNMA